MSFRICHLGKHYSPARGGIETHVRTLAQAQAGLGARVSVLCVNHERVRWHRWLAGKDAKATEEWDGPVQVRRLERRMSVFRWDVCPGIRKELSHLSQQSFDVFHLHVPNVTMLLALATIPCNIPLVITYHSDIVRQRRLYALVQPFERAVFQRASRLLATSPPYAEGSRVLRQYAEKVEVCPFGIDPEPFMNPNAVAREFRRSLTERFGQPLWLCVGRLVHYKGFDVALRALTRLPGKLLMVGAGALETRLRGLAQKLKVASRVVWNSRLTDAELAGAYHAATALWLPSNARSEAFGLVQVEAMASGCPVINTDIPGSGVPWVSRHEETGLTVPMNDPNALADASRRLLKETGLRERLVQCGRERAIAHFGNSTMASRSLEVYRDCLQRAPDGTHRSRAAAA